MNNNGYGGMFYYTSETCGYTAVDATVSTWCTNDYNDSDIKYVVDNWSQNKFQDNELKKVNSYGARLISIGDLEGLGYKKNKSSYPLNDNVLNWVYNSNYTYWAMNSIDNSSLWIVVSNGQIGNQNFLYRYAGYFLVRPVINIYKSAIEK